MSTQQEMYVDKLEQLLIAADKALEQKEGVGLTYYLAFFPSAKLEDQMQIIEELKAKS